MADLKELSEGVINGDRDKCQAVTQQLLDEGVSPNDIINQGLIPGMSVVGEKFKANEFYIPEVLIAARAMHAAMDIVQPLISESDLIPPGTVAIGTVQGDLHDIGKNLVAMMVEGAGFKVIDLGVDVNPDKFVGAVTNEGVDVLAMSALLTTTMPSMKETIAAVEEAGVRDKVKIIIGGAPVTQNYADEIGADGYAPDAASAVDTVKELLNLA